MKNLKKLADSYGPAYGFNYAALRNKAGDIIDELGYEWDCCSGCLKIALPLLQKEHGKRADLVNIQCNEEDHFPNCFVCGKIIETGLTYQEQEPEHFLSLPIEKLKSDLEDPYYAYQVYRLLNEYPEEKACIELHKRIKDF